MTNRKPDALESRQFFQTAGHGGISREIPHAARPAGSVEGLSMGRGFRPKLEPPPLKYFLVGTELPQQGG
jgi:hypothetical protein